MKTMVILMGTILLNIPTSLVQAQQDYWDRVLVPLYTQAPIEGSLGSLWTTELSVLVQGQESVVIDGYNFLCEVNPCFPPAVNPGRIFYPFLPETDLSGDYLFVEEGRADKVQVQLRARDLSRQAEDWGAEIPTIRESAAPVGGFDLLDLPADDRYRVMLRIYHFGDGDVPVTVRVYEAKPERKRADLHPRDTLLDEHHVDVSGGTFNEPGYGAVPALTVPPAFDVERYRISVEADTDVRLWGFATITNNETRHVTVVSPQ